MLKVYLRHTIRFQSIKLIAIQLIRIIIITAITIIAYSGTENQRQKIQVE